MLNKRFLRVSLLRHRNVVRQMRLVYLSHYPFLLHFHVEDKTFLNKNVRARIDFLSVNVAQKLKIPKCKVSRLISCDWPSQREVLQNRLKKKAFFDEAKLTTPLRWLKALNAALFWRGGIPFELRAFNACCAVVAWQKGWSFCVRPACPNELFLAEGSCWNVCCSKTVRSSLGLESFPLLRLKGRS